MVVPLKQYPYSRWCEIAAKNNELRSKHPDDKARWSSEDIWQLWHNLFRAT